MPTKSLGKIEMYSEDDNHNRTVKAEDPVNTSHALYTSCEGGQPNGVYEEVREIQTQRKSSSLEDAGSHAMNNLDFP